MRFSLSAFSAKKYMALVFTGVFSLLIQPLEARVVTAVSEYYLYAADANPPALLSQTGLYENIAANPRVLTDSIYPFEVNSPLWSDGSHKERFIQVPFGTKIIPTDTSNYMFPAGSVLIKNFAIDTVVGDTTTRILIETRFLAVSTGGVDTNFSGLSYRWRRDQTDADLVPSEGEDVVHNVMVDGMSKGKRWSYPGRIQCNDCHASDRRGSLGFITPQLNRPVKGNPSLNQLQDLFAKGVLASNPVQDKPNAHRWRAVEDQSASLEVRARSYLGANCSHCHGNGFAKVMSSHSFDYFDPNKTIVYDTVSEATWEGFVGKSAGWYDQYPFFIYPGRPDSSFILLRMASRSTFESYNEDQMPPLATYQVDSAAIKVVRDWICSMRTPPTPDASCRLPETEYEPYTAPSSIHRNLLAGRSGTRAFFLNGELKLVGHAISPAKIRLFDAKGRQVGLVPAGAGSFRTQTPLRSGLYFVQIGSQSLRLYYLQ